MPPKLTRLKDSVVDPQQEWTRRKLQVLFAVATVVVLALVGGGVWSMVRMLRPDPSSTERASISGDETAQDRLANESLTPASLEKAQPGTLSIGRTGTLQIPAPARIGAANVPSGFAHTPEGALAQLVAIDQTAIAPASVKTAQLVIDNWAAPGGPTSATWSGVKAVATMLSSAALPADGSGGLSVTVEPAMGFIRTTAEPASVTEDLVMTAKPPSAFKSTGSIVLTPRLRRLPMYVRGTGVGERRFTGWWKNVGRLR